MVTLLRVPIIVALAVKAALGQFEALVSTCIPANLIIFRFVADRHKIFEIVRRAQREDALVVFTLASVHLQDTCTLSRSSPARAPAGRGLVGCTRCPPLHAGGPRDGQGDD